MKIKSNLHTHSTYCDGKNTLEENIKEAIALDFRSIGFSGHANSGISDDTCCMSEETTKKYFSELENLKQKYKEKITVFKGIELEACNPENYLETDYSILSLHFLKTTSSFLSIDDTKEKLKEIIKELGQINFVNLYFDQLLSASSKINFDIVGHFDLYTKFNEQEILIDETNKRYQDIAINALEVLYKQGRIFEINTGAISRGYRKTVYPSLFILKKLKEWKAPIIISSDSHEKSNLSFYFDETQALLKSIGFKEQVELTVKGFKKISL
ncbi:MAG: histidinol-phosphatase [Sphaerochaetaceae bacterium]